MQLILNCTPPKYFLIALLNKKLISHIGNVVYNMVYFLRFQVFYCVQIPMEKGGTVYIYTHTSNVASSVVSPQLRFANGFSRQTQTARMTNTSHNFYGKAKFIYTTYKKEMSII